MEISNWKRVQIVALVQSGVKLVNVPSQLNVFPQLFSVTMKCFKITGNFNSLQRYGRPRVTTCVTDRAIKIAVTIDPTVSSSTIAANLPDQVSDRSVRRRLFNEFGLAARRPAKNHFYQRNCARLKTILWTISKFF